MSSPLPFKNFLYSLSLTIVGGVGGVFFIYFIPGFITYLNIGLSVVSSLTIMTFSILISSAFFSLLGTPALLIYTIEIWLLALFLIIAIKHNFNGTNALLGAFFFMALIFILNQTYLNTGDIHKKIEATHLEMEEILKKQQQNLKPDEQQALNNFIKKVKDYSIRYFPFLVSLGLITTSLANILLARYLAIRKDTKIFGPEFNLWQFSPHLVWIFIGAASLSLFFQEPYKMWGENLVLIMGIIYVIQGCAVMNFIFYAMDFPHWVRILFYILMFLQWYGIVFIFIVGLSDIWIEWRNKITPKKSQPQGNST